MLTLEHPQGRCFNPELPNCTYSSVSVWLKQNVDGSQVTFHQHSGSLSTTLTKAKPPFAFGDTFTDGLSFKPVTKDIHLIDINSSTTKQILSSSQCCHRSCEVSQVNVKLICEATSSSSQQMRRILFVHKRKCLHTRKAIEGYIQIFI